MRRRLMALAGGALVAVGLALFWATPAGAGDEEVSIFGGAVGAQGYDPFRAVVFKNQTVHWTNNGSVDHTVTRNGGGFNSGFINPGEDFRKTFRKVKKYLYHCSIHPNMDGKVVVKRPA
jgi:plastocyanin